MKYGVGFDHGCDSTRGSFAYMRSDSFNALLDGARNSAQISIAKHVQWCRQEAKVLPIPNLAKSGSICICQTKRMLLL